MLNFQNGAELTEIWRIYWWRNIKISHFLRNKYGNLPGVLYTKLFAFSNVLERPIYH
jgi:hypothetical protein